MQSKNADSKSVWGTKLNITMFVDRNSWLQLIVYLSPINSLKEVRIACMSICTYNKTLDILINV